MPATTNLGASSAPSPQANPRSRLRAVIVPVLVSTLAAALCSLSGCADDRPTPEQVRARVARLLPASVGDRAGWAADIQTAFTALEIAPDAQNLCAVLAVTEQESGFNPNPPVPGLGAIALKEIETRAARYKIPAFVVRGALKARSADGRSWEARIAEVRTEKELSDLYEQMIAKIPLGRRLLARANPVRTGGPMQVSIAFAEAHAKQRHYPYPTGDAIRHDVFTRRGGMYFGIAHLLDYPASYRKPLFRFADYNAGRYASRNAAFQNAVAVATGIALDLDGDLIAHRDSGKIGATEAAVRTLAEELNMDARAIHRALSDAHRHDFEDSALYRRVFEIADARNGRPLPRATLPRIRLHSPKITRKLTTEWFATRVNRRYAACMKKAGSSTRP